MRLMATVVISLLVATCNGCRTGSGAHNDAGLQSIDRVANADRPANKKSYDTPISYLEVSKSEGSGALDLKAQTEMDVLCERTCSHFNMVEENKDGAMTLKAVRTPEVGNTDPSRLDEKRSLNAASADYQKIIIKNVGKIGRDIVVTDELSSGRSALYATAAKIKPAMAIGGEGSGYMIEFNGKSMDAALDTPELASKVTAAADKTLSGFVTGYVTKESKVERGDVSVFHVTSIDTETEY